MENLILTIENKNLFVHISNLSKQYDYKRIFEMLHFTDKEYLKENKLNLRKLVLFFVSYRKKRNNKRYNKEHLSYFYEVFYNEKNIINLVHELLDKRVIHPNGTFDKQGRWYSNNSHIISVREPSRAYPYSQMKHCRTKKYVQNCYDEIKEKDFFTLLNYV